MTAIRRERITRTLYASANISSFSEEIRPSVSPLRFLDARGDEVRAFSRDDRNARTNPSRRLRNIKFSPCRILVVSSQHFTRHVDRISLNDMCIEYRMYNIYYSGRGASSLSFSLRRVQRILREIA